MDSILELLAEGYGLLEAPRVDKANRLYFSDHSNGGVYRRSPSGSVELLIPKRSHVGGLAFNHDGRLVVSGANLALWNESTGACSELFSGFPGRQGKYFNDLTVDSAGSVYVGSVNFDSSNISNSAHNPGDLYRVDPNGRSNLVWEGIEVSNGLGFNADETKLYHCNTIPGLVWEYTLTPDRTVKERRVFAKIEEGWPDGLAVDVEGGVWVAVAFTGQIRRFRSDGVLERTLHMPVKKVVSLAFGGSDMQDLYIVTAASRAHSGSIFRTKSEVPGLPIPPARF